MCVCIFVCVCTCVRACVHVRVCVCVRLCICRSQTRGSTSWWQVCVCMFRVSCCEWVGYVRGAGYSWAFLSLPLSLSWFRFLSLCLSLCLWFCTHPRRDWNSNSRTTTNIIAQTQTWTQFHAHTHTCWHTVAKKAPRAAAPPSPRLLSLSLSRCPSRSLYRPSPPRSAFDLYWCTFIYVCKCI